jgi:hypothetical protein
MTLRPQERIPYRRWTVVSLKMSRMVLFSVLCSLMVFVASRAAQAESYVAGMVGLTIPHDLSSLEVDDDRGFGGGPIPARGTKISDQDLTQSMMYGAKAGHYFETMRALGVELEAYTTTPHNKQQSVTATGPAVNPPVGSQTETLVGNYFRVTTLAFNLVGRLPGEVLQPYGGIGLGLFFANQKVAGGASQSSMAPGLNTQLGLRYMLNHNVALFGEWKFNYARFNFDGTDDAFGIKQTYMAHHLVFGVGYHF